MAQSKDDKNNNDIADIVGQIAGDGKKALDVAKNAAKGMDIKMPGLVGNIGKGLGIIAEAAHDKDPQHGVVEKVVCGSVRVVVEGTLSAPIYAPFVAGGGVIGSAGGPWGAAIGAVTVGAAVQPVVNEIVKPYGDLAQYGCHKAFDLFREPNNPANEQVAFMTKTKEDNNDFEIAKAKFKLNDSFNKTLFKENKRVENIAMPLDPKSIPSGINEQLFQVLTQKCSDIKSLDGMNSNNAFDVIKHKIEDYNTPREVRMEYMQSLIQTTGDYYKAMSSNLGNFGQLIDTISPEQKKTLDNLQASLNKISDKLGSDDTQKSIYTRLASLTESIEMANKAIANCKTTLGKVVIDQDKLFADSGIIKTYLTKNQEMMAALFETSNSVSIHGFEQNEGIVALANHLNHLKERQQKGEECREEMAKTTQAIKLQKAQITADRVQFKDNLKLANKAFNGIAALASHLGHEDIGHQIHVVGNASTSLIENGSSLLGIGVLAGTINPLIAIPNIASSILSVAGLFKRQSNEQSIHSKIYEEILKLSKLMEKMRTEMHDRFDEAKFERILQALSITEHFASLHQNDYEKQQALRLLYLGIYKEFNNQSDLLTGMMESLTSIEQQIELQEYATHSKRLKELFNLVRHHESKDHNLIANELHTLGLTHAANCQLNNPLKLNKALSPDSYFHCIKYFNDTEAKTNFLIPHPLLLTYSALINLQLSLNEYPEFNPRKERDAISRNDIKRFKEYEEALSRTEEFLLNARSPTKLKSLLAQYQSASRQLLAAFIKKEECIQTTLKDQHVQLLESKRASNMNESKQAYDQVIEPSSYKWFEGKHIQEKRYHIKKKWYWPTYFYDYTATTEKNNYINTMTQLILTQRKACNQMMNISHEHSHDFKISPFVSISPSLHSGIKYMNPEKAQMPVLPAPDPLLSREHENYKEIEPMYIAQALGLGYISYTYDYKDNGFEIKIQFKTGHETLTIATTTVKAETKNTLFNEAEASWYFWLGGTRPSKTLQYDRIDRGTRHGHHCEEFEDNRYQYSYPGEFQQVIGAINQFKNGTIKLTICPESIETLDRQIQTKIKALQMEVCNKFYKSMHFNDAILGKPLKDFEEAFRNLYGALSLGFYNSMSNPNNPLVLWFKKHASHMDAIKGILMMGKSPVEGMDALIKDMLLLDVSINQCLRKHTYQDNVFSLDFDLLVNTQFLLQSFLDVYAPFAVEKNKNTISSKAKDALTETLFETCVNLTENLLNSVEPKVAMPIINTTLIQLKEKLEGESPEVKNEFLARLELHFNQRNLLLQCNEKGQFLLKLKANEEPNLRFFGTGDQQREKSESKKNEFKY